VTDPITVSNITPPRVPLVDEAGLISRPWYLWLLNMFNRGNLGATTVSGIEAELEVLNGQVGSLALGPVVPSVVLPDYVGPAPYNLPPPSLGGLNTLLISVATTDQQLTNAAATIHFDTDTAGSFGPMTRVGDTFVTTVRGTFIFLFEPQILQNANNNVTTFWITLNGVAVAGSGVVYEAAAQGDSNVVSVSFAGVLQPNDVVSLRGITSNNNGATLKYTAAIPPKPSITAVQVIITGYQT
jgi:hypothetical protein